MWEIAGSGHIDAAMTAGMMLGLWAALALPAAWQPWHWRAPAVAVAVAALLYGPCLSVGAGVLGFMPAYVAEENSASAEAFWLVGAIGWLPGRTPG